VKEPISAAEISDIVGDKRQRGISEEFEGELTGGVLRPVLERLRRDDTLSLEIRNGYIDIYYRGGRLLNLRANAKATKFSTAFDEHYCDGGEWCPKLPPSPGKTIESAQQAQAWVDVFGAHKQIMDIHFSRSPKIEREYQQAVVRDNNRHHTGERSDYLVVDVEYAQSPAAFPERKANYRFDMVGFRWPLEGSGRGVVTPVVMEMKAGDAALAAGSGLAKHVRDIESFLKSAPGEIYSGPYLLMCREMLRSFALKQRLGLPSIPKRMQGLKISDVTTKPEVIFVIANHQPGSSVLHRELRGLEAGKRADYYVATVQHTGYALFAENMKPLDKFVAKLRKRDTAAGSAAV
jgi:hypothetical protein